LHQVAIPSGAATHAAESCPVFTCRFGQVLRFGG